jgi:hypothetical protein
MQNFLTQEMEISGRELVSVRSVSITSRRSAVTNHNQDNSMGPGDLHHFGPIKKPLAGKRFAAKADGKQTFSFWLQTTDTDYFTQECKL